MRAAEFCLSLEFYMSSLAAVRPAEPDIRAAMREIGARARAAARVVANARPETKTRALVAAARNLRESSPEILAAITGAPLNRFTPLMIAVLLSNATSAPSRAISLRCMNRFG